MTTAYQKLLNRGEIYPWQHKQWKALNSRLLGSGLAHALLLHGEQGTGVNHFAECFIRILLCLGEEKPCDNCRACSLYASGNHPDFWKLAPETKNGDIKVTQVRALADYLQITRHYGEFKIVLIENADAMNRAAANSLLKTLEEPPANVVIILTSYFPFRMPATVRSRCQTVRLLCNDHVQICKWLAEAEDIDETEAERRLIDCRWKPLYALSSQHGISDQVQSRENFLGDVNSLCKEDALLIEVAEKWREQPVMEVHHWLLELAETAIMKQFKDPLPDVSLHKLFSFYDRQKYRYLSRAIRFDSRLLIESALIEWRTVYPYAMKPIDSSLH